MEEQETTTVPLNNVPQEQIAVSPSLQNPVIKESVIDQGISTISKKIGEIRTILTKEETITIDGLQQIVAGFGAVQKQVEEYGIENARLQKIVDDMSKIINQ